MSCSKYASIKTNPRHKIPRPKRPALLSVPRHWIKASSHMKKTAKVTA